MTIDDDALYLSNAVSESRIWSRLMQLAEVGRAGPTGVDRPAFSPADRQARRLLADWGSQLGADVYQDRIGNLFLRYDPSGCSGPAVLTGSHLDSQPTGGRFDGVYGVIAALEVLEVFSLAQSAVRRPIEAVAWSNEEGSRFAPGAMGSQVFAGALDLASLKDVRDPSGVPLEQALKETIEALPRVRIRETWDQPYAYLEAHIEQGPILERGRIEIGAVDGIQGCVWVEYTVRGQAAHAGTTPMRDRKDAFRAALWLIERLEADCFDKAPDCRFTVGRVSVRPGSPNTIPDEVRFTVDLRERDPGLFNQAKQELLAPRASGHCSVDSNVLFQHSPQPFDTGLVSTVERAADRLGFSAVRLTSGAFHDALFVSDICKAAMIFVPCKGGISHHPDEYSSPQQLAAGARVLIASAYQIANEQPGRAAEESTVEAR